jgi:hypothetical protein
MINGCADEALPSNTLHDVSSSTYLCNSNVAFQSIVHVDMRICVQFDRDVDHLLNARLYKMIEVKTFSSETIGTNFPLE